MDEYNKSLENAETLARVVATLPAMVWETRGLAGDFFSQRPSFVSNRISAVLGIDGHEWLESSEAWVHSVYHPDRARMLSELRKMFVRKRGGTICCRALRWDGSIVWLESHCSVLLDRSNTPVGFTGVTVDVTERKQLERKSAETSLKYRSDREQLRLTITETNHRIKNNLNFIVLRLSQCIRNQTDASTKDELKQLQRYVQAISEIQTLLTAQAYEGAEYQTTDVRKIAERVLTILADSVHLDVSFDIGELTLTVPDATALILVMNELVSNALKHAKAKIHVVLSSSAKEVKLEVLDDGPGFSSGFKPKEAANVGFYLVDQLAVHQLGGEVAYATIPEGGAHVAVTLPGALTTPASDTTASCANH